MLHDILEQFDGQHQQRITNLLIIEVFDDNWEDTFQYLTIDCIRLDKRDKSISQLFDILMLFQRIHKENKWLQDGVIELHDLTISFG